MWVAGGRCVGWGALWFCVCWEDGLALFSYGLSVFLYVVCRGSVGGGKRFRYPLGIRLRRFIFCNRYPLGTRLGTRASFWRFCWRFSLGV